MSALARRPAGAAGTRRGRDRALLVLTLALASPAGAQDVSATHDGVLDSQLLGLAPMSHTPCTGGMAGIYSCSNVDVLSFVPGEALSPGTQPHSVSDLWGWKDERDGHEYAIVGMSDATSFVDITNPMSPIVVGYLPSHSGSSAWREIKVYAGHAFIVSEAEGDGLQVFDMSGLGDVAAPPVELSETTHYDAQGLSTARNVAIDEESGFAYVTGSNTCAGGLHMVDVRDPARPVFAGCYDGDGYVHDAQCVVYHGPDSARRGRQICFAYDEDTLTIVDVTDKSAPVQIARQSYPGVAYTHQGWTTEDQAFLLLDDEGDEQLFAHNTRTYIWDVTRLASPTLIGTYTALQKATDHNLFIRDRYAYLANYCAGMRILDISGIASGQLREVAYFDTVPGADVDFQLGAWSAYPFFSAGVVGVTDNRQGLFLLEPHLD